MHTSGSRFALRSEKNADGANYDTYHYHQQQCWNAATRKVALPKIYR
jgi:hypothetical protein